MVDEAEQSTRQKLTTIPQRPISSKFVRGERDVWVFVDKGLTVCGAFTVEIVSPKTVVDETRRSC
jgi:hypothetical protein